ncbi:MAG: stage II sporulation protein M [bacterium]|nr:stage II sporulation protein M [bacterium]
MKETRFIEQNKEKWNRFEQLYQSKSRDPEELSDLYMDITDDLSYAQTFYKRRTVRVYLNQLGQRVYTGVHKQKGESLKKFFTVWRTSLPLEIYRSRKNILFAFALFAIYFIIGAVTVSNDPFFAEQMFGTGYVEQTLYNIEQGKPLDVYTETSAKGHMDMFIYITTNNLYVALLTFFGGFFLTIGSHILLFNNGIMVGVFQYFFSTKGLLVTSFLGIWIHGAFEISAIVLAAAAGFTAGNGLLFPGSRTRMQALQISTKRGLKIMLSLVPFIITAGFLESYVTMNYQDLPDWSKWALIGLSFGLILFYYVFYPMYVARKHPDLLDKEESTTFQPRTGFRFKVIRPINEIVADSFRFFRVKLGTLFRINFLITVPLMIALIVFQDMRHYDQMLTEHWYDWASQLSFMMGFCFIDEFDYLVALVWTILIAFLFTSVFFTVKTHGQDFTWKSFWNYAGKRFFGVWLGNLFLAFVVFALPWEWLLLAFFILPFFYLNAATMGLDDTPFGKRLSKGFNYSAKNYGNGLLALLIMLCIVFIAAQPVAFVLSIHFTPFGPGVSDLLDIIAEFIKRVGQIFTDDYILYANIFRQFIYLIYVLVVLGVLSVMMSFAYFNEVERNEAAGLREAFKKFGKRSRNKETTVDFD